MGFRMPRRFLQACLASLLLGMIAGLWIMPAPSRAEDDALFFAATGHRLTNESGFLGYWRASNGPLTLGPPVTEPFVENGLTVQYFELGRLELHPEYNNAILRGRLGAEYIATLYRSFSAAAIVAEEPGARYFAETGFSLTEPFLSFWQNNGAVDAFGFPISAPAWEYVGAQMLRVQYFERARLEYQPSTDASMAIQVGALGRDLALLRGLPTTPVDPAGAPTVDNIGNLLPVAAPVAAPPVNTDTPGEAVAPTAVAPPAKTDAPAPAPVTVGGKSIIVDLSDQWLYALDDGEVVFDAPVSTGRDGFNTPTGNFAIYHKVRSQTMTGCAGDECWSVPDVPNAMYIVGGVALHGTYWHNQFGTGVRRSHGCVNLPLKSAAWLYNWAPLGTPVTVRW